MQDVEKWLESAGFQGKVKENSFEHAVNLPFVVYSHERDRNICADSGVYHSIPVYRVELYSALKDGGSKKKLEKLFREIGICYEAYSVVIPKERMRMTAYDDIFIKEE